MNREILRLAIPNIISNISVPLLSSVDTALMGRLSAFHLGAVGLGAMIFNFLYWNFGFLRMGTTGLTAQAFGRRDEEAIAGHLYRAMIVAIILALALWIFRYPLGHLSIWLMQVDGAQTSMVWEYFLLRLWAAPASLMLYGLMGWFFGMQNAIYPLILTICINVVNIALSWTLVVRYDMEVAGVALGTVGAQYFGLILGFFLLFFRYRAVLSSATRAAVIRWSSFLAYLKINQDIFLRTLFLTTAFAIFYSASSGLGEKILAVNVILLQFVNWMSYGIDGFAYAAESLVGKYLGREQFPLLKKVIRYCFYWCFGFALFYSMLFLIADQPLLHLFTDKRDIIVAAGEYMPYVIAYPVLGFLSYLWDGVFIGLTASRAMRNSMALSFIFFLMVYIGLLPIWGAHGIWVAMLTFMLFRGLIQTLQWRQKGISLT